MTFRRPRLAALPLALACAGYVLVFLNAAFWTRAQAGFGQVTGPSLAFATAYCALVTALFVLVCFRFLAKPLLIGLLIVAGCYAYFADSLGIVITQEVVRDVLTTDSAEARGFVSWALAWHVAVFALAPALLVAWVEVAHPPPLRQLVVNGGTVLACLALAGALVLASYADLMDAVGGRRELLRVSNPAGPVSALFSFASERLRSRKAGPLKPVATDARRGKTRAGERPLAIVLVVGESARGENFGLNGYERETSPELRAAGVVNFPEATSCGTATATSLPCMFSPFERRNFSDQKASWTENLLDVLKRVGVRVVWWDNQAGSKGVADRVEFRPVVPDESRCQGSDCPDLVLADELNRTLDESGGDSLIVLHLKGSHGPSYYQRYPPAFRRFVPECTTAHLADCSQQQIVNAYDNSLLYTDHVLGETIRKLQSREQGFDTALIYLSDHGESLGEGGLYMHGAPYLVAPRQQTRIPFAIWLSRGLAASIGIDVGCLRRQAGAPVSHDNLFHSVLGLMNVETSARDPKLDLFAACRSRMR